MAGVPPDSIIALSLPSGLTCNKSSGTISGVPLAKAGKTGYMIKAYNASGVDSVIDSITVVAGAVTVITMAYMTNPLVCTVGTAIMDSLAIAGGTYDSITLSTGKLPNGLSLTKTGNSMGKISGTPSQTANQTAFKMLSWTGGKKADSLTLSITVNSASIAKPGPLSFRYNPAVCSVSVAFSNSLTNSGGAADSIIASSLPAGLSCNKTTGLISANAYRNSRQNRVHNQGF